MKNIIHTIISFVKKNYLYLLPLSVLLIFISSIWDNNFYLGGDLMYPINAKSTILKSIFVWDQQNGGQNFFGYATLLWESFFYIIQMLNISPSYAEKILIISMFSLGFIFTYHCYRLLFKNTKFNDKNLAFLSAFVFCLNPATVLMPGAYPPLFAFPICYYFLIKFLDSNKLKFIIPFALFLNFHYFTDFPQPKILSVFGLSILFLIPIYAHVRNSKILTQIPKLIIALIMTLLINAFVLLPFLKDMFGQGGYFGYLSSPGNSYGGYADLYSASIVYISKLFNANLINDTSRLGQFLGNPIFITWTYILWAIILGGTFIIKDKKDKKLIYLLLIAITFFIFIAKGPNPPFERIYRYLLNTVPAFKIFRTTATVIFGGVLFYTFSLSISIYFLSQKWKKIIPIILISNILISSPIFLGYQFYRADQNNKGIKIPQEYFEMGKLLDTFKEENKVLALPLDNGYVSKTWMHSGSFLTSWLTKKPIVHSSTLGGINFTHDIDTFDTQSACLFTSVYNIGYLVWEKDSNHTTISNNLNFPGKILIDNPYLQLRKINANCTLPLFYIPDNVVFYTGPRNNMFSVVNFLNKKQQSVILQPRNTDSQKFLPPDTNKILIETSPENMNYDFNNGNYLRLYLGSAKLISDIWYPSVRIHPESPIYPLILLKEIEAEKSSNFDKRQLIDKKLFYASKRINEIDKWGVNNEWSKKSLLLYKQKIEDAIAVARNSANIKDNLELIVEYINLHHEKFNLIAKRDTFWDQEIKNSWTQLFESLVVKSKKSYQIPQFNELNYRVNISEKGMYKISTNIQNERVSGDVYVNNEKISTISSSLKDIGTLNLAANENNITIKINNTINLINSNDWNKVLRETVVKIDPSALFFRDNQIALPIPQNAPVLFQDIKDWRENQIYLLKINYQNSNGANLGIIINEIRNSYDQEHQNWTTSNKVIVNESLNLNEKYFALIKTDKNATGARIYIYGNNGEIEVKTIELQEVIVPNLIAQLEKNNDLKNNENTTVQFSKINPTKYTIRIEKPQKPFYLVFSESFNQGWQLKMNTKASGKKIIPENVHFQANGFANAWYMTPDLFGQMNSFEFELNYTTQRLFSIGMFISLITIIFCLFISYVTNLKKP